MAKAQDEHSAAAQGANLDFRRCRRRWWLLPASSVGGVSLAKIFLYDLAKLSSVTRALSFLAVGAVLLLAGFFYQRLTAATRQA